MPEAGARKRVTTRLTTLVVLLLPASCVTLCTLANPMAEHSARALCDRIPMGADLAPFVAEFDRENPGSNGRVSARHFAWDAPPGHTFMFPGLPFDRADCDVATDSSGRVISKKTEFLPD